MYKISIQVLVYTPYCLHDRFSNLNNNSIIIEVRLFAGDEGGMKVGGESHFAWKIKIHVEQYNYRPILFLWQIS